MLVTITGAMTFFLILIVGKVLRGSKILGDFTFLFSAFMAGWLAAEVVAAVVPPSNGLPAEALHFAVVLLFALVLALRWRWAIRMALQEAEE